LSETNPKKSDKNLAIFIIDSTWACTKKMFTLSSNLQKLKHMSFTTAKTSQYKIKEQPESHYLSTIESTLVVLELLDKWGVENISDKKLKGFLNPFYKMIEYQQKLIQNPLSNAVRFKKR
jgi:DTW domain-containing protein YfiP